jgi:hypothetical protein
MPSRAPLKTEGAGKTGRSPHPRSPVRKKCTGGVTTGSAETVRPSLRNGLNGLLRALPATNSSCHRHRRIEGLITPGWADKTSADLTPATGARTTRLHRTRPVFAKRLRRVWYPSGEALVKTEAAPFVCASVDRSQLSRKSRPASPLVPDAAASTAFDTDVRDDRDTPLMRAGTTPVISLMLANDQAEYFGVRARQFRGERCGSDLPVGQSRGRSGMRSIEPSRFHQSACGWRAGT